MISNDSASLSDSFLSEPPWGPNNLTDDNPSTHPTFHPLRKSQVNLIYIIVYIIIPLLKFTGRNIGVKGYLPLQKTPKSKSRELIIQFVGALLYTPNFSPVVPPFECFFGFCISKALRDTTQVLKSDLHEKPLDQSAIHLIAPRQLQPHLYQNIQNLDVFLIGSLDILDVSNNLIGLQSQ